MRLAMSRSRASSRQVDERLAFDARIRARAHEASAELAKIQFRDDVAREDADAQPRNVDAFRDHVYGDDPRIARFSERADAGRGVLEIRDDDLRLHARATFEHGRDEACVVLIHRRDESARIRVAERARFQEFAMRLAEHIAEPRFLRQRRAQPLARVPRVELVAEIRVHLDAVAADPLGIAALHREDERAANAVRERLRVIVREIRDARSRVIRHERDRRSVGSERRTGKRDAVPRVSEGIAQRLTPRRFFAGMVDLVEHDERRRARERGETVRRRRHLLIRYDRAVHVARQAGIRILEAVFEFDARAPPSRPRPAL